MIKEINGELCVSGVDAQQEFKTKSAALIGKWILEGMPMEYDKDGTVYIPVERAHAWFAGGGQG